MTKELNLNKLLKHISNLRKLVKESWISGYQQSMEDDFHNNGVETPFERSLFYKENKKHLKDGE